MKPELDSRRAILRLHSPDELRNHLQAEMEQMREEGYVIPDSDPTLPLIERAIDLIRMQVEGEPNSAEPDTLEAIRKLRPPQMVCLPPELTYDELYQRIYGGWLGRVAGCVLGKPVEAGWSKRQIEEYLKLAGAYPLDNYIPRLSPMPAGFEMNSGWRGCCRGEVCGALDDDDTDYSLLALVILEAGGLGFTTEDVAGHWLARLTYHHTWTAERAVYRSLIVGIAPAQAARFLNPSREYIGARIRADVYGMVAAGNSLRAAELAFRDAALSHTGNGIYSAMFMAACIACAFVTSDIEAVIRAGLAEIPADCRLARTIRQTLALRAEYPNWETAYERLLPKMSAYHPVHAINNTVWMVLALLYGAGDFEKTICIAVLCGMDTDCNGANAGSVAGIIAGADRLPQKWVSPLKDTLYSAVAGFPENRISELARRTTRLAQLFLATS